jgi:hypothetical protein
MNTRTKLAASLLAMWGVGMAAMPARMQAQEKRPHVVSPEELGVDAAKPVATRQANEAAVRYLLSSDAGQQALNAAQVDYRKVDKAVGQLNDEDLAKLAARSRQAESDFAAGFLSAKQLAYIILVLVVVITIIVLV